MSGDPVRVGLVGCGRITERGYLPALQSVDAARLVAVADPDRQRRERLAALGTAMLGHPVGAFDGAASLVANARVDAIVIASPATAHVADARLAAAAGLATLVEKPPAADAARALDLTGLRPMPWLAFNRRFDPGARAVRSAMPAHGPVELFLRLRYRRPSWGAHTVRDDALLDLGPHLLDWARWIIGREVDHVRCTELSTERTVLDVTLGRGRAHLEAATDRTHEELIELRDGSGRLIARHRIGGHWAGLRDRFLRRSHSNPLIISLRGELEAFVETVRTGSATDLGTPSDGVAVMTAIDAARASAAGGGRPVSLEVSG